MKKTIYDLTLSDLETWFIENGEKAYRARQVFSWLYRKCADSFDDMTDLSKTLIEKLKENFDMEVLELMERQVSIDMTTKYLFKLRDGLLIETVLMYMDYGKSVCVTSQVGCNMGCTFCASGLLKKRRDLSTGEMISQLLFVHKELMKKEERVSHCVVMGIGEPFDNFDNVINYLGIINHDLGLGIGARHLTVSTCGVVPRIKKFAEGKYQYNLAISLHAPNDELRSKIMPINKLYNLEKLMDSLRYYESLNNRRITFEYILLKNVNDQAEHATQLAKLIKGMNAYVNLIPYNVVNEHGYQAVDFEAAMRFYDQLHRRGVKCTLRAEHGRDIDAACGQLRAKKEGAL